MLHLILGTALGMKLYPVTVSATLADRIPDLAPLAEHAAAEVADARTTLERLAATLA